MSGTDGINPVGNRGLTPPKSVTDNGQQKPKLTGSIFDEKKSEIISQQTKIPNEPHKQPPKPENDAPKGQRVIKEGVEKGSKWLIDGEYYQDLNKDGILTEDERQPRK